MDRKQFYEILKKEYPRLLGSRLSAPQVKGVEGILDAFVTHGDGSPKTLAYALATALGEVGKTMMPVREGDSGRRGISDKEAIRRVQKLADKRGPRSNVAKYVRPDPETGHVYYGRGLVQLTWKENYAFSSKDAGVDLVQNPDAMLDPAISAKVLIKGLIDGRWNGKRKGIRYYLDKNDLKNARRTVNVTDKWELFAGFYKDFLEAIEKAGGVPKAVIIETVEAPKTSTAIAAAIAGLITAIAAAFGGDKIDLINQVLEILK